jgi:hypothetical protein
MRPFEATDQTFACIAGEYKTYSLSDNVATSGRAELEDGVAVRLSTDVSRTSVDAFFPILG